MTVVACAIPDVLTLLPRVFSDARGSFQESWNAAAFRSETGLDVPFVQDNHSVSVRGVLRGLHYQVDRPQGKLIRVVRGRVFDVVVDIRRGSPWCGQWVGTELSEDDGAVLWVPAGFAHGFYVLSERADVLYKTTDYRSPAGERVLPWNDPSIGIRWPLVDGAAPLLSDRDTAGVPLAEAELLAWSGPADVSLNPPSTS